MIISAAEDPTTDWTDTAQNLMGALVQLVGVQGVVVLVILAASLLKFPSLRRGLRKGLGRTIGWLYRLLVRYVRITVWAAAMGMPVRLANRLQPTRWREMCEARQLVGLKRGRVKRSPMGVDVRATLGGKLTLEYVVSRVQALETGLGVRRGSIRVMPTDAAHKVIIRITVRNPLKKPVPWQVPTGPISIKDDAQLSMTPFGDWVEMDLRQRVLIVGASGAGKSSVQRVLAAPVVLAEDAELEVWDLKQGTESQHYEGLADVRITSAKACAARIEQLLNRELPRRAEIMQKLGTSTWPTSARHPDRIVMVDEGAALIRALSDDELDQLFTLIEQARAYGIYLWWATQFPKSDNLPTQVRSQMSAVVALKMRRQSESRVVFEDLLREGWAPHRLPGVGWLMLLDDDHQEPEQGRAPWLSETAFRKLRRPKTDPDASSSSKAARPMPPAPVIPPMPSTPPPTPAATSYPVSLVKQGRETSQAPAPSAPAPDELPTPDAVLAALGESGTDTQSAAQLQLATGRGKSQVYAALQQLQDDGQVVRVGRGRYAVTSMNAGEVSA